MTRGYVRRSPDSGITVDPTTLRVGSLANSAAAGHRDEIARNGKLVVSDVSEHIGMDYAFQQKLDIYSARQAQQRAAYPASASAQ